MRPSSFKHAISRRSRASRDISATILLLDYEILNYFGNAARIPQNRSPELARGRPPPLVSLFSAAWPSPPPPAALVDDLDGGTAAANYYRAARASGAVRPGKRRAKVAPARATRGRQTAAHGVRRPRGVRSGNGGGGVDQIV